MEQRMTLAELIRSTAAVGEEYRRQARAAVQSGRLDRWEDRDGQTRSTPECVVSNLITLDGRRLDGRASVEHTEEGSFEEVDELPPQLAQPKRSAPAQRRNGR